MDRDSETARLEPEIAALSKMHDQKIMANPSLLNIFSEMQANVFDLELTARERWFVLHMFERFRYAGAYLDEQETSIIHEIDAKVAGLQADYKANQVNAVDAFEIHVDDVGKLNGLTADKIENARSRAGEKGGYSLSKPTAISGIYHSELASLTDRAMRQQVHEKVSSMSVGGEYDNSRNVLNQARAFAERTEMVDYRNYADFLIPTGLFESTEAIKDILHAIAPTVRTAARAELQQFAEAIGVAEIQPWDWGYAKETLLLQRVGIDEKDIREYHELDRVLNDGLFFAAEKLFRLTITELQGDHKPPVWHNDVRVFAVVHEQGQWLGHIYFDPYSREGKNGGAWTDPVRLKFTPTGQTPLVSVHLNIEKPVADGPVLLSQDDADMLFHEFGHAFHFLLSEGTFDPANRHLVFAWIEFVAKVFQRFRKHPHVLANFAKHHETGESMPAEMVEKLDEWTTAYRGVSTVFRMAGAIIDLAWSSLSSEQIPSGTFFTDDTVLVKDFEEAALAEFGLNFPQIGNSYPSQWFRHIFAHMGGFGTYYAQYWSYLVSDMLALMVFAQHIDPILEEEGGLTPKAGNFIIDNVFAPLETNLVQALRRLIGLNPNTESFLADQGLLWAHALLKLHPEATPEWLTSPDMCPPGTDLESWWNRGLTQAERAALIRAYPAEVLAMDMTHSPETVDAANQRRMKLRAYARDAQTRAQSAGPIADDAQTTEPSNPQPHSAQPGQPSNLRAENSAAADATGGHQEPTVRVAFTTDDIEEFVTHLADVVHDHPAGRIAVDLYYNSFTPADLGARLRQQPVIPGLVEVVAINRSGSTVPVYSSDAVFETAPDVSGTVVVLETPSALQHVSDVRPGVTSGLVTATRTENRTTTSESGTSTNAQYLTLHLVSAEGVGHAEIREALELPSPPPPNVEIRTNDLTVRCEIMLYQKNNGPEAYIAYHEPDIANPEFDTVRRMIDAALLDHFPDEAIEVHESYDYDSFTDQADEPRRIGPQPPSAAATSSVPKAGVEEPQTHQPAPTAKTPTPPRGDESGSTTTETDEARIRLEAARAALADLLGVATDLVEPGQVRQAIGIVAAWLRPLLAREEALTAVFGAGRLDELVLWIRARLELHRDVERANLRSFEGKATDPRVQEKVQTRHNRLRQRQMTLENELAELLGLSEPGHLGYPSPADPLAELRRIASAADAPQLAQFIVAVDNLFAAYAAFHRAGQVEAPIPSTAESEPSSASVDYATAESAAQPPAHIAQPAPPMPSEREAEVLRLVAEGKSDTEILAAMRLFDQRVGEAHVVRLVAQGQSRETIGAVLGMPPMQVDRFLAQLAAKFGTSDTVPVTPPDSDPASTEAPTNLIELSPRQLDMLRVVAGALSDTAANDSTTVSPDTLRHFRAEMDEYSAANTRTADATQTEPTDREREVLRLAAQGLSFRAIGKAIGVSGNTVRNDLDSLVAKLGAPGRAALLDATQPFQTTDSSNSSSSTSAARTALWARVAAMLADAPTPDPADAPDDAAETTSTTEGPADQANARDTFTEQEIAVLGLLAQDWHYRDIAVHLGVSLGFVRTTMRRAAQVFRTDGRDATTAEAARRGFISPDRDPHEASEDSAAESETRPTSDAPHSTPDEPISSDEPRIIGPQQPSAPATSPAPEAGVDEPSPTGPTGGLVSNHPRPPNRGKDHDTTP